MKVLHICAVGTTAKQLLTPQIDYFLSRNWSIEIACSPGQETEQLQQQGYVVHSIKIDRKITSISNIKSIYKLTELIQRNRYDFVHVHTPIASVLGRIAAKIAGVKGIVYTAHGFPFHDQSSLLQYRFYFTVEKFTALLTDLILTQSYEDFTTAQKSGLCPPQKVRHLSNGIDIERFRRDRIHSSSHQLRSALGIPETADLIIGTVGRLTRKKGSEYLIQAAASLLPQFPHLHILVIGGQLSTDPEPFQAQLFQQIRTLGIENNVTLANYRQDIPELLGLLDIFTLPSFTHEGLPRSILEAMAMELPVVATNIRGCREAVVDGETGLIVPPRNREKLVEALGKLLADSSLREKFGKAGRQRVEAEFNEDFVFQRLEKYYAELEV